MNTNPRCLPREAAPAYFRESKPQDLSTEEHPVRPEHQEELPGERQVVEEALGIRGVVGSYLLKDLSNYLNTNRCGCQVLRRERTGGWGASHRTHRTRLGFRTNVRDEPCERVYQISELSNEHRVAEREKSETFLYGDMIEIENASFGALRFEHCVDEEH